MYVVTSGSKRRQRGGIKRNGFATNVEAESKKLDATFADAISQCRPLAIPLTVGAVAAAAVLALLECGFGRTHYWLICCELS